MIVSDWLIIAIVWGTGVGGYYLGRATEAARQLEAERKAAALRRQIERRAR